MDEMVFMDYGPDAVPFTTSAVIAERTGIAHRRVKDAIRKYQSELKVFGLLGAYQTESTGGRPQEIVRLNEEQAALLLTFLKNTPVVVAFKTELVRQFYAMREELTKRKIQRARLKPVRRNMTDAIRDYVPDSPHKPMQYVNYTNLAYRTAFGMTAKALRRSRGADKNANAVDFLTADELKSVERVSAHISILLEMGLSYEEVSQILSRTNQFLAERK